jgi:hypothetical protein
MVGEFPELQGIMGAYYAQADGESPEVAVAIREHYMPRAAGDELPATHAGIVVAIADKLDTLTGIFAIGERPTGTKDPFGLRRAALGVLRILIEKGLDLDLRALIAQALALVRADMDKAALAAGRQWLGERRPDRTGRLPTRSRATYMTSSWSACAPTTWSVQRPQEQGRARPPSPLRCSTQRWPPNLLLLSISTRGSTR